MGLYLMARPWIPDTNSGTKTLVMIFTTIVCFHSVYLEILPASLSPWLFVMIMLSAALIPNTVISAREPEPCYYAPFLALVAILGIEYFSMLDHLLLSEEPVASWLLVSFASLTSLWVVLAGAGSASLREKYEYLLLGVAHTLAISAFYHLTRDINSLAVSAFWLFYAVAVMLFAFARKDAVMAKSALLVLGLAAGKALLYDAAAAATIVRIICLLLTGIVLYGSGFAMRKISGWKK